MMNPPVLQIVLIVPVVLIVPIVQVLIHLQVDQMELLQMEHSQVDQMELFPKDQMIIIIISFHFV